MFTVWGVITAATVIGGGPTVIGLWIWNRSRSARRNREGRCAHRGVDWRARAFSEPYLIQGRLVCEMCAADARRKIVRHVGVLGIAAATATGIAAAGASSVWLVLLPACSTVIMTTAAVQIMKNRNRDAERLIASGKYPEIDALR